jgi:LysR substrate binding domain
MRSRRRSIVEEKNLTWRSDLEEPRNFYGFAAPLATPRPRDSTVDTLKVATAAPSFRFAARLAAYDGIAWRSSRTGRIRERIMRNAAGTEIPVKLAETIVLDDPEATCRAALLGLGVTLMAVCHALPHLERGALVRLVPQWYSDNGPISIYYASRALLPSKRVSSSILLFRHSSVTALPNALPGAWVRVQRRSATIESGCCRGMSALGQGTNPLARESASRGAEQVAC